MAKNSTRQILFFIVIGVVTVLFLACLSVLQLWFSYSRSAVQRRLIKFDKDNTEFMLVGKYICVPYSMRKYIAEKYPKVTFLSHGFGYYIQSSQDVLRQGYTFVGEYTELDDESVYLAEKEMNDYYKDENCFVYLDNGTTVRLDKSGILPEDIVGRRLRKLLGHNGVEEFIVRGVVRMPQRFGSQYFCLPTYVNIGTEVSSATTMNNRYSYASTSVESGTPTWTCGRMDDGYFVLSQEGLHSIRSTTLRQNEIILTLQIYNQLFETDFVREDFIDAKTEPYAVRQIPPHLGEEIQVNFREADGFSIFNEQYRVVGISFDLQYDRSEVFIPDSDCRAINTKVYNRELIVKKDTVPNMRKFLNDMMNKHGLSVQGYHTSTLKNIENDMPKANTPLIIISVIGAVCFFVLLFVLTNFFVVRGVKEVGFAQAFTKDAYKTVLLRSLILAAAVFVVALGLSFGIAWWLGAPLIKKYGVTMQLFFVDWKTVLMLFGSSFGSIAAATVLPLWELKRLQNRLKV